MNVPATFSTNRGLTRVEVVVLVAVLVLLVVVIGLMPVSLRKAGNKVRISTCVTHLKQVGIAFRTWGSGSMDEYPMDRSTNRGGSKEFVAAGIAFPHFQVMSNELNAPEVLVCPSDDRQPSRDFKTLKNENVSYFVGADAAETFPAMFLAGDRNLMINGRPASAGIVSIASAETIAWSEKMHRGAGNVALADGSVQQISGPGVQQLLQRTETNVTRLIFP